MRSKTFIVCSALVVLVAAAALAIGIQIGASAGEKHVEAITSAPPQGRLPVAPLDASPAGQQIDAIRRGVPIDREGTPPPMARVENADLKRNCAYPMQPPTIPHSIDNYQIDKNSNRCMLCHARANADTFQAPPVSVTHYMDRDDQFLATLSPRRYFCNQCHVVQTDARPLVANGFKDIDTVLSGEKAN